MSEYIIVKHTKKIIKVWQDKHHTLRQRIGEILIEFVIIVFAITLSLVLERCREGQHDREIKKQFLLGLKEDLANDTQQEIHDNPSYAEDAFEWEYYRVATGFIPNNSRFEALKSSGELGVIENPVLENKILDLYQMKIKQLLNSTDNFKTFQMTQIIPFLFEKIDFKINGDCDLNDVLRLPEMQNYLLLGGDGLEIDARDGAVIQQSRDIVDMISSTFPKKPE